MSRLRRALGICAGSGLLLALLVGLVQAPSGSASSTRVEDAAAIGCKFSGKRYVGTTSQRKKLCLTLNASGTAVREAAYEYRSKCKQQGGVVQLTTSSGSVRSIFRTPLRLKADGSFATTGTGGFLKGKIGTRSASGTLRGQSTQQVPASVTPPITFVTAACDTGVVRWSARRASG